MKRSDFIKGLAAVFGLSVLPGTVVQQYHRYYLLQSFVRGFRFYKGLSLLPQMQEGNLLELVREPENEFDTKAIALYFNHQKIGFLPKEDNEILSRLMDAGVVTLQAEITRLNKEAQAWENVHIGVYVLKKTNEPVPENAKYLTVLETPHYRSLKINKDKIVQVSYGEEHDEDEIMDADSFYKTMVKNSKDNGIYDMLHSDFESGENLQRVITEGRMVIDKNALPADLGNDSLLHALDESMITLDNYFDKKGYVVANTNRVAALSARIEKVVNTVDASGRLFYEIRFS